MELVLFLYLAAAMAPSASCVTIALQAPGVSTQQSSVAAYASQTPFCLHFGCLQSNQKLYALIITLKIYSQSLVAVQVPTCS